MLEYWCFLGGLVSGALGSALGLPRGSGDPGSCIGCWAAASDVHSSNIEKILRTMGLLFIDGGDIDFDESGERRFGCPSRMPYLRLSVIGSGWISTLNSSGAACLKRISSSVERSCTRASERSSAMVQWHDM